jgi:Mrp family chromosome partitioning ATPase
VSPAGAEALRAALRRSLPLILALVVLGAIAMNIFMQARGPRHASGSRVLLTSNDLTPLLTGAQPAFVDQQQVHETALALADSPELYRRVARDADGRLGTPAEIDEATDVGGDDDNVIEFAVGSTKPEEAIDIANAVATGFIEWRAEIANREIVNAIEALRGQVAAQGPGSPRRETLQERLDDLELLSGASSGNAVVVERATEAAQTSPAPLRDTLLGAAIGLMVALLLVGAREAFDTKVRSEEDVEDLLDVPVLASVQSLPRRARLVMFGRNEELYGDAYALLAANLVPQTGGREKTLVIAVTSAIASEGKTTTASNLAIALARRGANVVLADFDVRKPSLGEVFHMPANALGVSQLLNGGAELEDVVWTVSLNGLGPMLQRPGENGSTPTRGAAEGSLRLIPAGEATRTGGIAQSPHTRGIIEKLRNGVGADVVVLDTPPALVTVEMAELSRMVDRILVVVRQGRVSRRSLRSLSRQIHQWRDKLAGAVLTDAPTEERHSYYYRTGRSG